MNAKEIRDILSEELKDPKGICIILSKPEDYHSVNLMVLNHLTVKMKLCGIYGTLNMPYSSLSTLLEKNDMDISKLFFIDCTGERITKNIKNGNCEYLKNPQSLTELSLMITELTNSGKFDFLFLDSISTLLIYNSLETTEKFAHYLINKIRILGLGGIIISLDDEKSNKIIPVISQFCDKCIRLTDR